MFFAHPMVFFRPAGVTKSMASKNNAKASGKTGANIIGIDMGATKIHAATVSHSGKILRQLLVPTPKKKGAAIAKIIELVNGLADKDTVAIGIGVPGPVDFEKQVVMLTSLGGWKNIPLAKLVTKATGFPCTVENDAKCFLQGEIQYGAAKSKKSAAGIIMGTGFGSALAIDGKIYRGAHGSAGEIGHTIISNRSGAPGFRNVGEIESFASGKAIAAMSKGTDAKAVFEKALKGDKQAIATIQKAAYGAGVGFATIINILDPEIIIIGGSLSNALPQMLPIMRKVIMRDCFAPATRTPIVRHKLEYPGTVGAAVVAAANIER
jgi:glucokinase